MSNKGKITRFQIISPRRSKAKIDDIDRYLAKVYNFSKDETEYLEHYDERFRMQENEVEGE